MTKVSRIQLLIIGMVIIGFSSMGREFMLLWMGKDFLDSYYVALLLISPGIISFTQEIGNTSLVALNKVKHKAFIYIIAACISITLSIILAPRYGAIGSAVGICIGSIIGRIIIMNIIYHKILHINIFRFFKECHLKMLLPLALAGATGFAIQHYFPVDNMGLFMIKALVFAVIYFILMWTMALNKYEKDLFLSILKKAKSLIRK